MLRVAFSMSYQKSIWIFWLLPREMRNRFSLIHCMHIGHLIAQGRSYCNYCFIDEQQCREMNRLVLQEEQICFPLWSVIQQTHLGHIYPITVELRWGVLLLPHIRSQALYGKGGNMKLYWQSPAEVLSSPINLRDIWENIPFIFSCFIFCIEER